VEPSVPNLASAIFTASTKAMFRVPSISRYVPSSAAKLAGCVPHFSATAAKSCARSFCAASMQASPIMKVTREL